MTDEERKAIDILQNCIADYVIGDFCCGKYCPDEDMCENDDCYYEKAIDTVIKLINKQEKAIDRMAEEIVYLTEFVEDETPFIFTDNNKTKIKEYFMEDKE